MKASIKTQWLAALRSGEYEQTQEKLRDSENSNAFCCLGVLCDLHSKEDSGQWSTTEWLAEYCYMGTDGVLPAEVCAWAGLLEPNPVVPDPNEKGCDAPIAALNDRGLSFQEIADIIEAHIPAEAE